MNAYIIPGIKLPVIKAVAEYYNVTEDQIKSRSRKGEFTKARHIAMYLLRNNIDEFGNRPTFDSIGLMLNRDHSDVIHAVKKITWQREHYSDIDAQIKKIETRINRNYHD